MLHSRRNIVQVEVDTDTGTELAWTLIDLDASCPIGEDAGQKLTSSYVWTATVVQPIVVIACLSVLALPLLCASRCCLQRLLSTRDGAATTR